MTVIQVFLHLTGLKSLKRLKLIILQNLPKILLEFPNPKNKFIQEKEKAKGKDGEKKLILPTNNHQILKKMTIKLTNRTIQLIVTMNKNRATNKKYGSPKMK